ncbi:sensor histidine kinase [Povalibacter sp.]|uniref:sensor histidine kinase n=1 Tax=Povalibacter sp. TaxID=1962978 RepID=UPI002F410F4D
MPIAVTSSIAAAWLAGIVLYLVAIASAGDATKVWINDVSWMVAAIVACWSCLWTARRVGGEAARGWWLLGAGCGSWGIGQCVWNYNELVLGMPMPFFGIGQIFYSSFPLLAIAAISQLSDGHQGAPFMPKQLGNVALVLCCLAMTVVLGLIEPAIGSGAPHTLLWLAAFHCLGSAFMFLYALYSLWTYRWASTWSVMLKLVVGFGIYAICTLVYIRSLMLSTYLPGDIVNASWLLLFGLISWAAAERGSLRTDRPASLSRRLLRRERWLEAVVPALLIIIMISVGILSSETLTPRVLIWTAALFILFAIILGVREALIQQDAQRLNNEIMEANRRLNEANMELRDSEVRYRDLTVALEKRVADRTAQLQRAYGELEGFSYAVAHDLKAPLRAIDGFAHLLRDELGGQVSPQADAHLKRIRGGAIKMAALIDDLLSYANIERRELNSRHMDLQPLVQSVVDEYADEIERRSVAMTVAVEPLTLFLDTDGLALALRNLLGNALKYSSGAAAPAIEVRAQRSGDGALLIIKDNGIGFDMTYHDRIFNVFQRLHRDDQYPGTGIGLALVRKAVERMGGRVWAQSTVGSGATFFLEVPTAALLQD